MKKSLHKNVMFSMVFPESAELPTPQIELLPPPPPLATKRKAARAASEAVSKAAKQVLLLLCLKMTIPWSFII